MESYLKEKIGYYKTLVTLCWTSSFILGSGIAWALINLTIWKLFLVPAGVTFEIALLGAIIFFDSRIRTLLKELTK